MTLKKTALEKNSANKFLWTKIVNGLKTHDTMFNFMRQFTYKSVLINDDRYKVLRY